MRKTAILATVVIFGSSLISASQVDAQSSDPDYDIKLCNNSPYTSDGCKNTLAHYVKGQNASAHVAADAKSLAKECNPKCPSSYNLSQISAWAKRDFAHRVV